ncbi:MAG: single-stranded DNA-binding protein, partial [Anaerolineae bacterium]|nr:single-stranded DNA-binding protein [Anaerolineae bacterium]
MAKLNKIQIIGRLGKDPEMSYKGQDGDTAVTKISVAADRKRDKETTDWFNVVAFGQTAEFINQ